MILYKYLPPARLNVLQNAQLRFTQPGDFNDPFEFKPRIDRAASGQLTKQFVEENLERLLDEQLSTFCAVVPANTRDQLKSFLMGQKEMLPAVFKLLDPRIVSATSKALNSLFDQNVGILCLSESRDSLLMWGHYTDNHRGFVVGFDSDHAFFSKRRTDQDDFGFLRRVKYQRERPGVTLAESDSAAWFQTKSEDWSYEKEWRIARVLTDANHRSGGAAFPICLFDFPPDCVREIVLGIRATDELSREVQKLISEFPQATLLRARESPSQYGLIIENATATSHVKGKRSGV